MLIIDDEVVEVPSLAGPMRVHVLRPKDATKSYPGELAGRL